MCSSYLLHTWAVFSDSDSINPICLRLSDPFHLKSDLITSNKQTHFLFASYIIQTSEQLQVFLPTQLLHHLHSFQSRVLLLHGHPWHGRFSIPGCLAGHLAFLQHPVPLQKPPLSLLLVASRPHFPVCQRSFLTLRRERTSAVPLPHLTRYCLRWPLRTKDIPDISNRRNRQTQLYCITAQFSTSTNSEINLYKHHFNDSYPIQLQNASKPRRCLTFEEQQVLNSRSRWWILLVITALPFLQLNSKLVLRNTSRTLWINANQICVISALLLQQTWKQFNKTSLNHRIAFWNLIKKIISWIQLNLIEFMFQTHMLGIFYGNNI